MKAYASYRPSGSPWLTSIPDHWSLGRFRFEASINGGQVDPRVPPWSAMTLVAPNHIEADTGRLIDHETAAEQGADSGKYLVEAGQIVYSKIRPALNKATVVDEDCLCSADMYAMSFTARTHPKYALYQLLARPFHSYCAVLSMRVKMPKVNRDDLADAPWLLPPSDEQRAIADYLDRETARIDELMAEQKRLVDMLQDRRRSLLEGAVFGLDESRPGWRSPRFIGRHRAVEPQLSRIPSHWDIQRFKSMFLRSDERNVDLRFGMMSLKSTGEVVPRATTGARQEPDEKSLPRYLIARVDDLVVNPMWLVGGAIGVSQVDGAVSPDYRVFRARPGLNPRYLHHLLRSRPYLDQYKLYTRAQTTFDRRVQQPDLDNMPIPLPPLDEQVEIAARIDVATGHIDVLIDEAECLIDLARERRSALITAAVTGQIDVGSGT